MSVLFGQFATTKEGIPTAKLLQKQCKNVDTISIEQKAEAIQHFKKSIVTIQKENFRNQNELEHLENNIVLLINNYMRIKSARSKKKKTKKKKNEQTLDEQRDIERRWQASIETDHQQHLGQLLYVLRNEPKYLARLTRTVIKSDDMNKIIELLIFTLYGDQFDANEEYRMLGVFDTVLREEYAHCLHMSTFMRSNTAFTKMLGHMCRRKVYNQYLIEAVQKPILEILQDDTLDLELTLSNIYTTLRASLSEEEKADKVKWPSMATNAVIAEMDAVQDILKERFELLKEKVMLILNSVYASVNVAPYGVRFICKKIYEYGLAKFGDEHSKEDILVLVGGFLFLRFLNPPIATYNLKLLKLTDTIHSLERRQKTNLKFISKIIQNLSNNAMYGIKEIHMKPLNGFLESQIENIRKFFLTFIDVEDIEEKTKLLEFSEIVMSNTGEITISHQDLNSLQSLLVRHIDGIVGEKVEDVDLQFLSNMKNDHESVHPSTSFHVVVAAKPPKEEEKVPVQEPTMASSEALPLEKGSEENASEDNIPEDNVPEENPPQENNIKDINEEETNKEKKNKEEKEEEDPEEDEKVTKDQEVPPVDLDELFKTIVTGFPTLPEKLSNPHQTITLKAINPNPSSTEEWIEENEAKQDQFHFEKIICKALRNTPPLPGDQPRILLHSVISSGKKFASMKDDFDTAKDYKEAQEAMEALILEYGWRDDPTYPKDTQQDAQQFESDHIIQLLLHYLEHQKLNKAKVETEHSAMKEYHTEMTNRHKEILEGIGVYKKLAENVLGKMFQANDQQDDTNAIKKRVGPFYYSFMELLVLGVIQSTDINKSLHKNIKCSILSDSPGSFIVKAKFKVAIRSLSKIEIHLKLAELLELQKEGKETFVPENCDRLVELGVPQLVQLINLRFGNDHSKPQKIGKKKKRRRHTTRN